MAVFGFYICKMLIDVMQK